MPEFDFVAESRRAVAKARVRWAAAIIFAAGPIAMASATADGAGVDSPSLEIAMTHDRISIEVDEVPIGKILESIAAEAGFEVEMRGNMDEPVSRSVIDLPVHLALGRLLDSGRYSFVVEFAASASKSGVARVGKLTVISSAPSNTGPGPEIVVAPQDSGTFEDVEANAEAEAAAMAEAVETLEQILLEEQDPEIREAAEEALSELDDLSANDQQQ